MQADITILLNQVAEGDRAATDALIPLVYEELRELAEAHLRSERAEHTLQATALAHEAYIRLVGERDVTWENRAHFFGAAAQAIRRILVDHARARAAQKRGGGGKRLSLDETPTLTCGAGGERDEDVLALNGALDRLAELDPRKARLVVLRYFGGVRVEDAAQLLGISVRTAMRDWEFSRAWLAHQIADPGDPSGRSADSPHSETHHGS